MVRYCNSPPCHAAI